MEDDNNIEIGSSYTTELLVEYGEEEISQYIAESTDGLTTKIHTFDSEKYLTIEQDNRMVFTYGGTRFIFSSPSDEIYIHIPVGAQALVDENFNGYQVMFNEDQPITNIKGQDIYLSDIKLMVDENITLNQARHLNGRERVEEGSISAQDVREFRDDVTKATGIIIGGTFAAGGTYVTMQAINQVTNPDIITDRMREVFVREYTNGVLRGMGKAVPKTAGSLFGRHMDFGAEVISTLNDSELSLLQKATATADAAFDEYMETKMDKTIFDASGRLIKGTKIDKLAESMSDFAGRMGNKSATFARGKLETQISQSGFKLGDPISEDYAIAAREETRRAMQEAREEAAELAKKSNLSPRATRKAERLAAQATERAALEVTQEAMRRGDDAAGLLNSIQHAADEAAIGIGKIVGKIHNATEIARNTTLGQRAIGAGQWIAKSKVGSVVRFGGKALVIAAPMMDFAEGVLTAEEGFEELEAARLTAGENDDNAAKAKVTDGLVTGLAGATATVATVGTVALGVAGGATVGASIAAAATLASNPVGWVVGAGLLVNYGFKYFTGKSLTERATNAIFGVEEEKSETERQNEIERPNSDQPIAQVEARQNEVVPEVKEEINVEVPYEVSEAFKKIAMDDKENPTTIFAVNDELSRMVSVEGTEFENNPMVDYNIPGQVTVRATFAKSEEAGIALIRTMTGLEGAALEEAVAQARIEMNKPGNEGQAFFRSIRNENGFKERMALGMPEIIAATVSDRSEYDMMAANLEKGGQTVAADTIRQLAIQTAPNFTPFIDPSLLEYQSVPESLAVNRNFAFTDEIDFSRSKSTSPAINS